MNFLGGHLDPRGTGQGRRQGSAVVSRKSFSEYFRKKVLTEVEIEILRAVLDIQK